MQPLLPSRSPLSLWPRPRGERFSTKIDIVHAMKQLTVLLVIAVMGEPAENAPTAGQAALPAPEIPTERFALVISCSGAAVSLCD